MGVTEFSDYDDDISNVRDVYRKTFETLELNVKTCLRITKLIDTIAASQGSGLWRWSRTSCDPFFRQFKEDIQSLQKKEDALLLMRCPELEKAARLGGETCTILGSAMIRLQSIDRKLREEIANPLRFHFTRKTPPNYERLLDTAFPIIQDALSASDLVEHEIIQLRAGSAPAIKQMILTVTDPKCLGKGYSS